MRQYIEIKKACTNNLKCIDLKIPHNKLVVITGVSGSGKSSLAFDTIYAEGQRRFVESMSAYTRQFLERMPRPDVESISGIRPAIAIQQRTQAKNPRSTVGTLTEIYDYLRLVFGRIGKTICKKCHQEVNKENPHSVFDYLRKNVDEGTKLLITFPPSDNFKKINEFKKRITEQGFTRVYNLAEGEIQILDEINISDVLTFKNFVIVADRVVFRTDEETKSRIIDSLEIAFSFGDGRVWIVFPEAKKIKKFSNNYECADCEIIYKEPEPRLFSFNNPYGACPVCQGFGRTMDIDEDLVIPDKSKSLRQGALHPFRTNSFTNIMNEILEAAIKSGISIDKPIKDFTPQEYDFLWNGNEHFWGLNEYFRYLQEKNYKVQNRIMLARYRGFTTCRACGGSRIRTSARQVYVANKNIPELVKYPLDKLYEFFENIKLTKYEEKVVGQVIEHIKWRLNLLIDIGLHYLTLDRLAHTLSGGEMQRISLANALGSSLVETLFVLDEPSIGLHPRDTNRLLNVLNRLRDAGNTIIVVEHDPDIIRQADMIIDLGPGAGEKGGNLVFQGTYEEILNAKNSITGQYLSGRKKVRIDKKTRDEGLGTIRIYKARQHNLKIDYLEIPLGLMTVVTGVSGSGKSTLLYDVIYKGLYNIMIKNEATTSAFEKIDVDGYFSRVELVDQNPIGKSSRSTLATFSKVFDLIRELYSETPLAKQLGLKPGYFSFNVPGGRCEVCQGEGYVTIDMQFLPDVQLVCEACKGTRYKKEVRNILYKGKSIVDVLNMTVDEAIDFFYDEPKIVQKLQIYQDIGLGYIRLGQPSTTLSGGESQRIKLASYLDQPDTENVVLLFDEPTTGLHLDDISKLLVCFDKLVDNGNTVIIIEHNLHIISAADFVVDLGPEGGDEGGKVVCTGSPKKIAQCKNSHTGKALKEFYKMSNKKIETTKVKN
ncbi:MAG: excinuclease ABC subunit UvrA [Ignavibacteria bacterium]|nr:excinuclease ABC subunit UvrA [Ignavibacteria bacterium]